MDARADADAEIVVTAGLHAGARRTVRRNDLLLVGGAEACDVVLADGGVARRHCLVGMRAGMAMVEALDASLRVDGQLLAAGSQSLLAPGAELRIGEATLRLSLPGGAFAQAAGAAGDAPRAPPSRALVVAGALAVLALAAILIAAGRAPATPDAGPAAAAAIESLRGSDGVEDLSLADGDQGLRVVGRVRDAQVRARIAAALPGAALDVVVGEQLAADVRQALRGFDLLADARYLGGGVVEIVSSARDQDAIRRAIGAERARGNLAGLSEVALSAVDAAPAPSAVAEDDGKRIVAVVDGADPHARTADGSTYGIGARLPDGGLVVGIGSGVLRVLYGDEIRVIDIDAAPAARPLAMR